MNVEIVELESRAKWESILQDFDDRTVFAHPQFLETTAQIFQLRNIVLLIQESEKPIAALPVQIVDWKRGMFHRRKVRSVQMGDVGILFHKSLSLRDRTQAYHFILSELSRLLIREGIHEASIPLDPSFNRSKAPSQFQIKKKIERVILFDANQDSAAFRNLTVRSIKKARESNLTAKLTSWHQELDTYWKLHLETYERTGAMPHQKEYFSMMLQFETLNLCALYKALDSQGRTIAFLNIGRAPGVSWYWTGCSSKAAQNIGANHFLMDFCLRAEKNRGVKIFNLGEIFPNEKRGKLAGLTFFKTGFGGVDVASDYLTWSPEIPSRTFFEAKAYKVWDKIKSWARRT